MSPIDPNTSLARVLVDEWARAGVRDAVLSPGSRSTPLALALAADERIRLSVFLDERSASFFALGAAKASGQPAVVLSTSGTAAANFHPAVLEAWHARVPLLVCTADRPPELRDTGAGQAADQIKLYGGAVRWFVEVGAPEELPSTPFGPGSGAGHYWRSLASRAWASAMGPPAGPVHLNLAFREPLVPTGDPLVEAPGRPGGEPWTRSRPHPPQPHPEDVATLTAAIDAAPRGVLVAGWGAGLSRPVVDRFTRAAGWPVLADAVSGVRAGPTAVSTYDPLLRSPDFAAAQVPDLVVHVGAALTNRPATAWLNQAGARVLIDPDGAWLDPHRTATRRIVADPEELLRVVTERVCWRGRGEWLDRWMTAEAAARATIDELLDSWETPFEGRVVRDVAACLPHGATLVVGSSMPVRDAESFVAPRAGVRWLANRGVNGIDGFVSTVLGVAQAKTTASGQRTGGPVVGLLGDLTLLHDAGALLWAASRGIDAVLVVLDNDGGGIFSFLPQAQGKQFERLFGTPHRLDLTAVAAAYGLPAQRVTAAADVVPAVLEAVEAGGVRIVVVPTDRADNVARHRQVWEVVALSVRRARPERRGP